MPETVPLRVQLVAKTEFFPPADVPWETDADGGQALAEFAGRACYQSWAKPNPVTATNAGYLRHILEVGHLSVLEHGSVSFYLTGVSRSLTHELIRHRHFSYSQLSQRYVPERNAAMVEPDAIAADPELHAIFDEAAATAIKAYEELLAGLQRRFADGCWPCWSPRPTCRTATPATGWWRCCGNGSPRSRSCGPTAGTPGGWSPGPRPCWP